MVVDLLLFLVFVPLNMLPLAVGWRRFESISLRSYWYRSVSFSQAFIHDELLAQYCSASFSQAFIHDALLAMLLQCFFQSRHSFMMMHRLHCSNG